MKHRSMKRGNKCGKRWHKAKHHSRCRMKTRITLTTLAVLHESNRLFLKRKWGEQHHEKKAEIMIKLGMFKQLSIAVQLLDGVRELSCRMEKTDLNMKIFRGGKEILLLHQVSTDFEDPYTFSVGPEKATDSFYFVSKRKAFLFQRK
uniref:Uncharacterized protein n=1 Tax=Trypanosoma congolense (strain IL3000) TaxID=1068625 RepID=G0V1T9_TRYCI|nr:hypothetical protein, unlikely [Trypanosoma congolense IL3000]